MRPTTDLAHLVPGAPDPLQAARHRAGRLDQHHQVDRAHVDAQLQRAGGDDARGSRPRFSPSSISRALLVRDAAVVGAHQLLAGQLVQALGQALAQAAAVDEDDGGAVWPRICSSSCG